MDPRENCIDLKPGSFLLILPSFLDSEEETTTRTFFFIPSPLVLSRPRIESRPCGFRGCQGAKSWK